MFNLFILPSINLKWEEFFKNGLLHRVTVKTYKKQRFSDLHQTNWVRISVAGPQNLHVKVLGATTTGAQVWEERETHGKILPTDLLTSYNCERRQAARQRWVGEKGGERKAPVTGPVTVRKAPPQRPPPTRALVQLHIHTFILDSLLTESSLQTKFIIQMWC